MESVKQILTNWTDADIRNVLHCDPSLSCELIRSLGGGIDLYDTANGKLAVGDGIGESGASFDRAVIREVDIESI